MKKILFGAALLFLSASAPAADSHCRVVKLASLPIEFIDLQPILRGKFNGVDLSLIMDSGAETTTLFPPAIDKAGLQTTVSDITGVGIGGRSEVYIALADEVEIGPSRGKKARFLEMLDGDMDVDGLLGADYLFRTDLEMRLRDNLVTFLVPDGDCDDKPLAYWDHDASWVEMRKGRGSDRREQVEVKINGHRFTALLDSGATQSALDSYAAAKIGLTPDSAGAVSTGDVVSGVGARKMAVWRAPIESFEIGDEAVQKTYIQVTDLYGAAHYSAGPVLEMSEPDMLLGADFMRAHHLLFAHSQDRLYFTYLGGPVFALEPSPQELAAQTAQYRAGAEKRSAPEMLSFAQMLAMGRGVEKDRVEAYKWLLIASQGEWAATHPDFEKAVSREISALLSQLDEQQVAEAKRRASEAAPLRTP